MRMSPCRNLLLVILSLMLCTAALAQNRAIEGKVTDDKGQPLADVKIRIMGIDNPRDLECETNKKGEYIYLLGLQSGRYNVIAHKEGFEPMLEQNVRPEIRETVRVDFEMTPGQDRKFPMEMSDEEREEYDRKAEKQRKYQRFSAAVKDHFDKGEELAKKKKYEEAIVEYNAALELNPEQPGIQARAGDTYKKLEKYEEALAAYEKAIELDPANSNFYSNKGDILNKLGKVEEAQEAFEKATEMNPSGGAQDLYNLGVTHYNEGRMTEASSFFRKAIEKDNNYAEAYYLLATCLSADMDTIPEALDLFQQYIDLGGKRENVEIAKEMIKALKEFAN